MYIIAIGWLFCALMFAVGSDSIVAAVFTFLFWGPLPLALFIYLFSGRVRRERAAAREREEDEDHKAG